jgi:death-on-curing protein
VRYLTAEQIIRINEVEVGPNLLADFGLVDAAAQRPMQSAFGQDAYPGIHEKAAALFHSLVKNHAFIDGNKRTAVVALGIFYLLNGWKLVAEQGQIVDLALGVAEGTIDVSTLAGMLKDLSREA